MQHQSSARGGSSTASGHARFVKHTEQRGEKFGQYQNRHRSAVVELLGAAGSERQVKGTRCLPVSMNLSPTILFFPSVVAIQTIRDVLSSVAITSSGDGLAGVGYDFGFLGMDRKIFRLERLVVGHRCFPERVTITRAAQRVAWGKVASSFGDGVLRGDSLERSHYPVVETTHRNLRYFNMIAGAARQD
jgi:hypothetical protein